MNPAIILFPWIEEVDHKGKPATEITAGSQYCITAAEIIPLLKENKLTVIGNDYPLTVLSDENKILCLLDDYTSKKYPLVPQLFFLANGGLQINIADRYPIGAESVKDLLEARGIASELITSSQVDIIGSYDITKIIALFEQLRSLAQPSHHCDSCINYIDKYKFCPNCSCRLTDAELSQSEICDMIRRRIIATAKVTNQRESSASGLFTRVSLLRSTQGSDGIKFEFNYPRFTKFVRWLESQLGAQIHGDEIVTLPKNDPELKAYQAKLKRPVFVIGTTTSATVLVIPAADLEEWFPGLLNLAEVRGDWIYNPWQSEYPNILQLTQAFYYHDQWLEQPRCQCKKK